MNKHKIKTLFAFLFLLSASQVRAQGGAGSMTVENSIGNIAEGTTEMRFSQETYFGPDADWTVDGTLEIWSEKVWIAPTARFSGSGRIVFHNPGDSPYYTSTTDGATYVDGNNSTFLDLIVEHANAHRIVLDDLEENSGSRFYIDNIGLTSLGSQCPMPADPLDIECPTKPFIITNPMLINQAKKQKQL